MITGILLLLLAYVAGSFPSGLIIGKTFYHVDLRDYGSHNIGATNAYRVLGKTAGAAVLLLDTGKGVMGVYLGQWSGVYFPEYITYTMIAGGLLAIAGHSCSLFLKFNGGKGVATGLGVILYLAPQETLIVFIIWASIVMRSAMGALFKIPVVQHVELADVLHFCKVSGRHLFGTSPYGKISYADMEYSRPIVLAFGNEGNGLTDDFLQSCDELISIPMCRNTESLNLSMSVGIVIYKAWEIQAFREDRND